jgi:hypothetical protein
MSFTATVENGSIKLPQGVELPDGTTVHVEPVEKKIPTLAERLAPWIGIVTDMPSDLAENHDHYLYGIPKRKK